MSNTKIWFVSILLAAIVAAFAGFHDVLLLFFSAAVFAFLLTPFVNLLQKLFRSKGRLVPSLVAMLIALCVLAGILALVLPPLYKQIENLVASIDLYVDKASEIFDQIVRHLESFGFSDKILSILDNATASLGTAVTSLVTSAGSYILAQTTKLVNVLIVLIMTVYLMKDGAKILKNTLNFFNNYLQIRLKRIGSELNDLIWGYLKIKILTSAVVFFVTLIAYSVLKIPNALLLAILAFLLEFIPYFGPIVSAVIAFFAALVTKNFSTALWVLALDILIQQIDGNIIEPIVQGRRADVHPLAIVISLLVCEKIWGVLGMFIACPMAGFARVLLYELRDLYRSIDSPQGFGYATPEPLIHSESDESAARRRGEKLKTKLKEKLASKRNKKNKV